MEALGIDIGGSGMKAARIDTLTGEALSERVRVETPEGAKRSDMLSLVREFLEGHDHWSGPVGVGFPGVVTKGIVRTAANVDDGWVGYDLGEAVRALGASPVSVINDADAAGLAEAQFGAGSRSEGLVVMLTVGTGIGTALIHQGKLVPNSELGHLLTPDGEAEALLSQRTRKREDLGWKRWSARFSSYLRQLEALLWPDLFILGGGGAKKPERILPHLDCRTPVVPASFGNRAGIVGAACHAAHQV